MNHELKDFTMADLEAHIASPYTPKKDKDAAREELKRRLEEAK